MVERDLRKLLMRSPGGWELVNPIGAKFQVDKMVVQKNLREIFPVCKTPENPPQISQ